ncbi:MAG: RNA polymerase sigma-70 factor [Bacteroidota bacterium]
MKQSDSHILHEIRNNNSQVFEELYNAYYVSLCHFAYKYIDDKDEVEDIVQETMTNIWEKRKTIIVENFKNYLFTSVKNKCLNRIHHKKMQNKHHSAIAHDILLFEIESDTNYTERFEKSTQEKVEEVLQLLPEKMQNALRMKYIEGLNSKEIAEITHTSNRTIETQLYKGMKKIAENFKHVLHKLFIFLFF